MRAVLRRSEYRQADQDKTLRNGSSTRSGDGLLTDNQPLPQAPMDHSVRYIYSGNEKIAMLRPDENGTEQLYYFINNAQGTPVMILDNSGAVTAVINLDEWGTIGKKTDCPETEINFTGKKFDPVSRLYYFNQRWYDPEIGRFMQEDPAGQGLSAYAYCGNNPLVYVDADGEFFFALAAMIVDAAVKGAIAGAFIGGSVGVASAAMNGGNLVEGMFNGAAQGAMAGAMSGEE